MLDISNALVAESEEVSAAGFEDPVESVSTEVDAVKAADQSP